MEYNKEEALEREMLIDSILGSLTELEVDWDDSKEAEMEAVDGYENWSDPNEQD